MKLTPVRFSSVYEFHNKSNKVDSAYRTYQDDPTSIQGQQWFRAVQKALAQAPYRDTIKKTSDLKLVKILLGNVGLTGRDIEQYKYFSAENPIRSGDIEAERNRMGNYLQKHGKTFQEVPDIYLDKLN